LKADATERCLVLPTQSIAERCRCFILQQRAAAGNIKSGTEDVRVAQCTVGLQVVHVTLLSEADWSFAKAFWQHTGDGVSSRFAERCLQGAGVSLLGSTSTNGKAAGKDEAELWEDADSYVEERYGRNLCPDQADEAKRLMRQRIAGEIIKHDHKAANNSDEASNKSTGRTLTEDDVYLYSCGMSAISNTHRLLSAMHPDRKSVCFG
jgi:cystathionine gamma-synthase